MNFKSLFLSLLVVSFSINTFGKPDTTKINSGRVLIVSSSLAAALGGSYLYVENAWWSDKQTKFSFDDGADLTYALNVDKAGHFMGGLYAADLFSSSFRWTGMNEMQSLWYGAAFGSGLQLAIEIKDAYAPHWGFQ